MTQDWKELAYKKRKESQTDKIPQQWIIEESLKNQFNEKTPVCILELYPKLLSEAELHITEGFNAQELISKIIDRTFSAYDVCKAFCHRSAIATQLTNCCTEILFDDALERAKFLDDYLEKNGKPFGPLHGLPVSVKDSHFIKGYDSTVGYVSFIGNKSKITENAASVQVLINLGAVIHVKTNVPMTMMTADSENNIWGRTLSPNNLTFTAGGSSGGEGSLVAQRGSLIGIGTDIAGSIRIPSLSCGIYGLKPGFDRFPIYGQATPSFRENYPRGISVSAGPLAYYLEDINFICDAMINQGNAAAFDPHMIDIPWNTDLFIKKNSLKIGVVYESPTVPLQPPLKRIIREAANKLSKAGHKIVDISSISPDYAKANTLSLKLFVSDPEDTSLKNVQISGEPLINSLLLSSMDESMFPKTISELIDVRIEQEELKAKWNKIISENELDIILSPASPHTATPHDTYGSAVYTVMWNLVNFPSIVLPFGQADKTIDKADNNIEYLAGTCINGYDPELYDGGVGHIQLSVKTLNDEKLLRMAEKINSCLSTE